MFVFLFNIISYFENLRNCRGPGDEEMFKTVKGNCAGRYINPQNLCSNRFLLYLEGQKNSAYFGVQPHVDLITISSSPFPSSGGA